MRFYTPKLIQTMGEKNIHTHRSSKEKKMVTISSSCHYDGDGDADSDMERFFSIRFPYVFAIRHK